MVDNKVSRYTIELDIERGDKVRQNLADLDKAFNRLSENAKKDIKSGLADAEKDAEKLAQKMLDVAKTGDDAAEEMAAYSRASNKAIAELDKQAARLNYSLSEEGKQQRAILKSLEEEKAALSQTNADKRRAKEIDKEIRKIRSQIIEGTDEELELAIRRNTSIRATLRLSQQQARIVQENAKHNKKMIEYVKADIKGIQEKIKAQFKFIEALKTTEGRYKALKKAAVSIGSGAAKIAKAGAIGAGGLIGGALALGGSAISHADSIVEREKEANRLKISGSEDEKQKILGDLRISTGRDYTTIVDAINRVTSVLGENLSHDDLIQAARTEIIYPGASAIFRQQNSGKVQSTDFAIYANRMKSIQGATGATVDQIQSATNRIANMRQSSFSNASMTDLLSVYTGLQNSGAYDNQEELDRAFNRFVRSQKQSGENVFEHAKSFDWSKTVWSATNKQQVKTAIGNMNFSKLENASNVKDTNINYSAAEQTAMDMRQMEETKNELLMNVLKALQPVIKEIKPAELTPFFNGIIEIVKTIAPYLSKIIAFLTDSLDKLIQSVEAIYNGLKNSKLGQWMGFKDVEVDDRHKLGDDINTLGRNGEARANGGIAMMPSIVGEKGPEMVIPLDFSRHSRGRDLMQTLVQNFNMRGNETTVLSLSQAVKSRSFTRAMADNAYINSRLGR